MVLLLLVPLQPLLCPNMLLAIKLLLSVVQLCTMRLRCLLLRLLLLLPQRLGICCHAHAELLLLPVELLQQSSQRGNSTVHMGARLPLHLWRAVLAAASAVPCRCHA